MNIKEEKIKVRNKIKTLINEPSSIAIMEEASTLQKDVSYCKAFLNKISSYKYAKTVFSYVAMKDEFPTFGLLKQIIKDGKVLALPRVDGKNLIFQQVLLENDEISPLEKGAYGILEPSKEARICFPLTKDGLENLLPILIIVPGRSFSFKGERLGHGGGFYDRFFSQLFKSVDRSAVSLVGVCFSFQISERLPRGKYDVLVDEVLTEKVWCFYLNGTSKNWYF